MYIQYYAYNNNTICVHASCPLDITFSYYLSTFLKTHFSELQIITKTLRLITKQFQETGLTHELTGALRVLQPLTSEGYWAHKDQHPVHRPERDKQ